MVELCLMTTVDIVIPVLNEERDLPGCVERLRAFCQERMAPEYACRTIVADNGSTDRTLEIAKGLQDKYPREAGWIHLPERGRGRALRKAWLESPAEVVAFMDVDLSTDLEALPPLVQAIAKEGYDIAIGSRLMKGSVVERRTLKREIVSRSYNLLVKTMFFTHFSDAQCGFKAMSHKAAQEILPLTKDTGWFLDSEILIIAEKNGYRIKDVPVHWVDDPDTRVNIAKTASGDIKGLLRLRFGDLRRASKVLRAAKATSQPEKA